MPYNQTKPLAVILGSTIVFDRSIIFNDDELNIRVIHKNDLIAAKRKAGRSKDLDDLENLLYHVISMVAGYYFQ